MQTIKPFLEIVEQPRPAVRFRYLSENTGAANVYGVKDSGKDSKREYPKFRLFNYSNPYILIVSSVSSDSVANDTAKYYPHPRVKLSDVVTPNDSLLDVNMPGHPSPEIQLRKSSERMMMTVKRTIFVILTCLLSLATATFKTQLPVSQSVLDEFLNQLNNTLVQDGNMTTGYMDTRPRVVSVIHQIFTK